MKRAVAGLFVALGVAAVASVYAYAACGSLRVASSTVSDGNCYIGMAAWLLDGRPADMHEVPSMNRSLPVGYPAFIAALHFFGLATQEGLIALNLSCLLIALCGFAVLLRSDFKFSPETVCAILFMFTASTVCCELSVTVASEMPFLAASAMTLICLRRLTVPTSILAGLACGASIAIRTVGVALIPAIIWTIAQQPVVKPFLTRRSLIAAAVPAAFAVWFAAKQLVHTGYVSNDFLGRYGSGAAWDVIFTQQIAKFGGLGELLANCRAEDFRSVYRGEFALLTVVVAPLVALGLWSRRHQIGPVDVYVVTYLALIALYPFFGYGGNRRYWFSILPFLLGLAYVGVRHLWERIPRLAGLARGFLAVYVTAYVLLGCVLFIRSANFERFTDSRAADALAAIR